MTTAAELLKHDFTENGHISRRYMKASSLPAIERYKHRPSPRKMRRDRALKAILVRDMRSTLTRLIRQGDFHLS